jgi:tetratricopeptide (TPR) repeat protein
MRGNTKVTVVFLIFSVVLIFGGWLGYSYYAAQIKFDEKVSVRDLASAKNFLDDWEKTPAFWVLRNIPRIKQEAAFKKGWLLAQFGAYEEALKEFRKAANIPASLKERSLYNAATIALAGGKESLEQLAEDYVKVLVSDPDDFQAKVNLEIVRILQQQAQAQAGQKDGSGEGKEKGKKLRKYQPGDKEGSGGSDNQGIRY